MGHPPPRSAVCRRATRTNYSRAHANCPEEVAGDREQCQSGAMMPGTVSYDEPFTDVDVEAVSPGPEDPPGRSRWRKAHSGWGARPGAITEDKTGRGLGDSGFKAFRPWTRPGHSRSDCSSKPVLKLHGLQGAPLQAVHCVPRMVRFAYHDARRLPRACA